MSNTLFEPHISSEKNDKISVGGRPSKTVRKFTDQYVPKWLPDSVCVNLDWYASTATCGIPEPIEGQISYPITEDLALLYLEKGTQMYKHSYQVIYMGEPVANLHTHSRNKRFVKEGRVKFELLNNALYSSEWAFLKSYIFEALQMDCETIGRLDIAIDGCNHLPVFLNAYKKQSSRNKTVELKGRAFFHSGMLDKKTMMDNTFRIGSRKGHKYISIYNKTKELDVSCKEYIRTMWEKSGLDTSQDNWRCELRMDSQALAEIDGLDITRLWDPHYLLTIFRTHTKNFFEFVKVKTDSNISRATVIDLFQFKKLLVTVMDKIPRAVVRGAYKAKMLVHQVISTVLLGYTKGENAVHQLFAATEQMNLYNLGRWYRKKLPQWIEMYQPHGMNENNNLVMQLVRV